ncbi:MAG: prolyl-tRNA synthetase associated domain-containing protein [Beijerinckiaceae bacterium]|nr:prolyl-tRNA synthetase associated domain-containing protein [Beijerinckiaceae bacterium]
MTDSPAPPATNAALALLAELGIHAATVEHPPLYTVEESRALRGEIAGAHTKNLFLKDKGSNLFLVTAEESSPLDLKQIDKVIGAKGRVSFASAEQLLDALGILPGSVSPLALVNDRTGRVRFILEERLAEEPVINVHPLVNTMTTSIAAADLRRYIEATGHAITVLPLPYREMAEPPA